MKVLYLTRLFSGLESSFINKKWNPTGVPTIYKLIEELDKKHDTKFIFSAKDSSEGHLSSWSYSKDKVILVAGLSKRIKVLAGVDFFFSWLPRRVAMVFREIRQYIYLFFEILRFKPDIIYCDHANVIIGALLSRMQWRTFVVFRVMGVYPSMRLSLTSKGFINKVFKWAYRSPFDLVICTQDGSGVEPWLKKAIANDVKIQVLLNGVDKTNILNIDILNSQLQGVPQEKKIILFVGKLEVYKGCYDFLDAFFILIDRGIENIHALIIGTGSEELKLKKLVEERKNGHRFTFISRLPHDQISAAHRLSDIYVSMNHLGNLSNSNLEAIQSNSCMIIPSPQPVNGVDVVTNTLLGDSITSVTIKNPTMLADSISFLISSKRERVRKSKLLAKKKVDFLWSWDERIKMEIMLLEQLLSAKND